MNIAQPSLQPPRYLTGLGISLAVHVLLVVLWQVSRPVPAADATLREMQFVRVLPPAERVETTPPVPALPLPPPLRVETPMRTPARRQADLQEQQPVFAPQAPAPVPSAEPSASPASLAAPAPSAADLLQQAKAAAGGIDSTLRKENPRRGIQAPVVTATMKLERGIARAAEMAPNKWYQAPKVSEVLDPGGYGRRRYRVVTAAGTYCVTYESNHAPDGIDSMQHGIKPKKTNCDDDEEPATFQNWNHKGP